MQKKGNIAFQGKPPKNLPKMKLGEAKDSKSAEKHLISREIRCFMVAETGIEPATSGL